MPSPTHLRVKGSRLGAFFALLEQNHMPTACAGPRHLTLRSCLLVLNVNLYSTEGRKSLKHSSLRRHLTHTTLSSLSVAKQTRGSPRYPYAFHRYTLHSPPCSPAPSAEPATSILRNRLRFTPSVNPTTLANVMCSYSFRAFWLDTVKVNSSVFCLSLTTEFYDPETPSLSRRSSDLCPFLLLLPCRFGPCPSPTCRSPSQGICITALVSRYLTN